MAKTYKKDNECVILKGLSVKVSDDVVAIVTYQYHTEHDPVDSRKIDHEKSWYRWVTRIDTIDNIKAFAQRSMQDDVRLTPWKWPNDKTYDGKIFAGDSTMGKCGEWFSLKLRKAVPWEDGVKRLNGWVPHKNDYNPNAKYVTEGYVADNGDTNLSLTDREALLKHVGQNLVYLVPKKEKKNKKTKIQVESKTVAA